MGFKLKVENPSCDLCDHAALRQSREAGMPNFDRVRSDPAFAKMKETEEFKELLNGD